MKKIVLNIFSVLLLIFLCFFGFEAQAETQNYDQTNRPKVSVIVPVYNVAKWLPECMESLVHQSLKKIEIICVDDGSTDDSGKILDEYASKYSKEDDITIKVIHKKNGGCWSARNAGLDVATGEYIAFVDSDDYVHPLTYEYAYNYAAKDNVDVLRFNHRSFKDGKDNFNVDDINLNDAPVTSLPDFLKRCVPNFCWRYLFKFNLIKDDSIRFVGDVRPADDTCFTFMSMAKAKVIKHIPGKFYNWRKSRAGQITSSPAAQQSYERLPLLKHVINSWKDRKCLEGNESLLLDVLIRWTSSWRPDIALAHSDEILSYLSPYIYDQNIVDGCSKKAREFIGKLKESSKLPKNEKPSDNKSETSKENLKVA